MRRGFRPVLAIAALSLAGGTAAGCSSSNDPTSRASGAEAEPTSYAKRGPFPVGVVDLSTDPDHHLLVFYPAEAPPKDAKPYSYSGSEVLGAAMAKVLPRAFQTPVAPENTWVQVPASSDGPFPTVLFSHGYGSNYRFSSLHNSHTASWGYVVIAVDHPERGLLNSLAPPSGAAPDVSDSAQLLDALDLVVREAQPAGSLLHGVVDPDRLAAEGHSAGGRSSGALAYPGKIDLWMGQAPVPPVPDEAVSDAGGFAAFDFSAWSESHRPPAVASLILAADGDVAVSLPEVKEVYEWLDSPKRLVVLDRAGHNAFTDLCGPIQADGGLSGTIKAMGLDPDSLPIVRLGEDGCLAENPPARDELNVINHVTVAQLGEVFGERPETATASLTLPWLHKQFPDLVESVSDERQG